MRESSWQRSYCLMFFLPCHFLHLPHSAPLSVKLPLVRGNGAQSNYAAVHRTFPGTDKAITANCDPTTYNPTERPWFKNAVQDKIFVEFYNETFSKKLVINLASKVVVAGAGAGNDVTVVAAALMLLDDVSAMIATLR